MPSAPKERMTPSLQFHPIWRVPTVMMRVLTELDNVCAVVMVLQSVITWAIVLVKILRDYKFSLEGS